MFQNFKSAKGTEEFYNLQSLCFVLMSHIHPMVSCMEFEGGVSHPIRVIDQKNVNAYFKLHKRIVEICLYDKPSTIGEVKLLHHNFFSLLVEKGIAPLGNSLAGYISDRRSDSSFRKLYEDSYDGKDFDDWLSFVPGNVETGETFFVDFDKLLMLVQKWQEKR